MMSFFSSVLIMKSWFFIFLYDFSPPCLRAMEFFSFYISKGMLVFIVELSGDFIIFSLFL